MPWEKKWLVTFYIGFYLFGVGEVCPRTVNELALAIILMIINSIINGIVIGNMALYLSEMAKKKNEFQAKMDTVNMAMKQIGTPGELKSEITQFFFTTNSTR